MAVHFEIWGSKINKFIGDQHSKETIEQKLYPLVIKHGSGKSPINGGFNRKSMINGPFCIAMFDYRSVIGLKLRFSSCSGDVFFKSTGGLLVAWGAALNFLVMVLENPGITETTNL